MKRKKITIGDENENVNDKKQQKYFTENEGKKKKGKEKQKRWKKFTMKKAMFCDKMIRGIFFSPSSLLVQERSILLFEIDVYFPYTLVQHNK